MVISFDTEQSDHNPQPPNDKDQSNNLHRSNSSCSDGLTLEIQEFVGNHKEFRIENNLIHMRIIGNNNRVILKCNSGKLDIIGHSTKVKIISNCGKINYVGNNGKIYLGRSSKVTSVQYTGNHGCVRLLDMPFVMPNRSKSQEKSPSNNIDTNNKKKHTHSSVDTLSSPIISVNVKNNISLPNLEEIMQQEHKLKCSTTFKISSSSSDIFVNNFFRKSS